MERAAGGRAGDRARGDGRRGRRDSGRAPGDRRGAAGATAGDPYDEGLARARVLVERRVWYDALGVYTDLVARFPDRPEAYEQRATLYAQIPATLAQAEEDFARADALAVR